MHDLERDELVVGAVAAGDEEEGRVAAVYYFGVCGGRGVRRWAFEVRGLAGWSGRCRNGPLYSRKLHMRFRRARTSCETSLMILALSFGESVVNHLARR